MIYDCFLFSNELDLLEIRLNELKDTVDKFVLLESDHTISGIPKPLYYHDNADRFKEFEDKIIHVVYDYPQEIKNVILPQCHIENKEAWIRESLSRDLIRENVGVKNDDIVIIADADEITSPVAITDYNIGMGGMTLVQKLYYYRLNCYCPTYIWGWAKIVPGKLFNESTPQQIRYARMPNLRAPGGWHFSFIGGPEAISDKLKAFAHQEYNKPPFTNIEYIKLCMELPKDVLNRPEIALQYVPVDYSFPDYVQKNIDKYKGMDMIGGIK